MKISSVTNAIKYLSKLLKILEYDKYIYSYDIFKIFSDYNSMSIPVLHRGKLIHASAINLLPNDHINIVEGSTRYPDLKNIQDIVTFEYYPCNSLNFALNLKTDIRCKIKTTCINSVDFKYINMVSSSNLKYLKVLCINSLKINYSSETWLEKLANIISLENNRNLPKEPLNSNYDDYILGIDKLHEVIEDSVTSIFLSWYAKKFNKLKPTITTSGKAVFLYLVKKNLTPPYYQYLLHSKKVEENITFILDNKKNACHPTYPCNYCFTPKQDNYSMEILNTLPKNCII